MKPRNALRVKSYAVLKRLQLYNRGTLCAKQNARYPIRSMFPLKNVPGRKPRNALRVKSCAVLKIARVSKSPIVAINSALDRPDFFFLSFHLFRSCA